MALFTILSDELEEQTFPLTLSNSTIGLGNSNITLAQFEYDTNQL